MRGTRCCLEVRAEGELLVVCLGVDGLGDAVRSETFLLATSNLVGANGGGNGDIERPDVEAVWA